VVWVAFLEEPPEVVCGRPRLMLVAACGGRDAPHAGATRLPIVVIVVVGCGHDPLRVLLALLFATLPATVDRPCAI
jgi:hypothetical protein